jgi:tetratricopeptide (TPR) repeat protein
LLERVGDLQFKLGLNAPAEGTYREALALARQGNESERISHLLQQLGLLAEGRGEQDQALSYYQEALDRSVELANAREQQDLWMRQGAVYARRREWQLANSAHEKALALAMQHDDEEAQAELHTRLGNSAFARSDWSKALGEFQTALALHEKLGAPREQAYDLMRIADAQAQAGELLRADEAYSNALDLAPLVAGLDKRELWLKRASLAEQQHRWQDAAACYTGALETPGEYDPETQIDLLFRRGDSELLSHAWSRADTSFNDAMELANSSGHRLQYGWGMNRLGLLSQAQRQWNDALENFQEAIEIFRVNEHPLGEAHVLNNIARLKLETNDPSQADLFSQAALAIAQAFGSNVEAAKSFYTRGLVLAQAQEYEAAQRLLAQATGADPANWAAQLQLGNTLLAGGDMDAATTQAEKGLGQNPDWELGAQAQLTIASLYQEDPRPYKANSKRARNLLRSSTEKRNVSQEYLEAVEWILQAMDGQVDEALSALNASEQQPALPIALEARRFAILALRALAQTPRKFKNKATLVEYLAPSKSQPRKSSKRRGGPSREQDTEENSRLSGDTE